MIYSSERVIAVILLNLTDADEILNEISALQSLVMITEQ